MVLSKEENYVEIRTRYTFPEYLHLHNFNGALDRISHPCDMHKFKPNVPAVNLIFLTDRIQNKIATVKSTIQT